MEPTDHSQPHAQTWKDWLIRVVLVSLGVTLLFFTPAFLEGHTLAKVGGFLATLSGLLGQHRMGEFTTFVLLTLVYVFAVAPMRVVTKFIGENPMAAPAGPSLWHTKPKPNPEIEPQRRIRFQF